MRTKKMRLRMLKRMMTMTKIEKRHFLRIHFIFFSPIHHFVLLFFVQTSGLVATPLVFIAAVCCLLFTCSLFVFFFFFQGPVFASC